MCIMRNGVEHGAVVLLCVVRREDAAFEGWHL